MRFLLVGDYRDNNGPNNVNKEIIRHKSAAFSNVCVTSRYWKYQDAVIKVLFSDVVVVSGTAKLNLFAMKLAKKLGKKTIYIIHGCAVYEAKINGHILPERDIRQEEELLEYADLILPVSEKYGQWVKNHFPQHAHKTGFWYLGLVRQQAVCCEKRRGNTVAAAGGTLRLKKNQVVSNAVESMNGAAKLMVYGAAPEGTYTPNPHTEWVGAVSHDAFIEGLSRADVFVVNSVVESFNISVMEALNCGCSILISRNVGAAGLLDLTDDDIIFNIDDEGELARKIDNLFRNPNHRRISDKIAWEELGYDKAVSHLEEICRKLAEESR